MVAKPGAENRSRDECSGNLFTGCMLPGIEMARSCFGGSFATTGTDDVMLRETAKRQKSRPRVSMHINRDGLTSMSDEAAVMAVEQRSQVDQVRGLIQLSELRRRS